MPQVEYGVDPAWEGVEPVPAWRWKAEMMPQYWYVNILYNTPADLEAAMADVAVKIGRILVGGPIYDRVGSRYTAGLAIERRDMTPE